jgi:hypothetical protein
MQNRFKFEQDELLMLSIRHEFWFYKYDNQVFYKNLFNDTIYQIVNMTLHPKWVFNKGQYSPPLHPIKSPQDGNMLLANYYQLLPIFETDAYLFFSLEHREVHNVYLYDKQKKELILLSKDIDTMGFYNDWDGGLSFWPVHVSEKQELISFVRPRELINNRNKKTDIRNRDAANRLNTLIDNLTTSDNPIVVIAKLKE